MGKASGAFSAVFILTVACAGEIATGTAHPRAVHDSPSALAVTQANPTKVANAPADAGTRAPKPSPVVPTSNASQVKFHLAVDGQELSFVPLGRGWALAGLQGFARYENCGWQYQCLPSDIFRIAGEFPNRVGRTNLRPWASCAGDPKLYRKRGKRFDFSREISGHEMLIAPWVNGSTLAAFVPYRQGPPWGYQLVVLEGNEPTPIPTPSRNRSTDPTTPKCYTRLEYPTNLITFPTGEILVIGTPECTGAAIAATDTGACIVRGARGQQRGTIERLPVVGTTEGAAPSVGARSPNDIYVSGVLPGTEIPALVHFDGDAWSLQVKNLPGVLGSFAFEKPNPDLVENAATWFIANGELWRWVSPFDDPTRVPLPEGAKVPLTVWVDGVDLWLLCDSGVYTTAETKSPWKWPEQTDCNFQLGPDPSHSVNTGCGESSQEFRSTDPDFGN